VGVNAPGRPTMMTFFSAQYSATLILAGSGNPWKTSTDGILDGVANARGAVPKVAPATACRPARAARERLKSFIFNFMTALVLCVAHVRTEISVTSFGGK